MKRLIVALLLLAAATTPARAWLAQGGSVVTTSQVLMTAATSGASASADNFLPVNYAAIPNATDDKYTVFPVAGTITTMRVRVNGTAPTGVQSWTVTLRKNGSDTTSECIVNSSSSSVCSISSSVSFAAGDWGNVRLRPTNSPTTARLQVAFNFQPTTANDTFVSGFGPAFSASATQAGVPNSSQSTSSVVNRRIPVFPDGGTIDRLFIVSNAPTGAGKYYDYTIDQNGSTTAVTTRVEDAETTDNDTTHSFSVTAGDDVQVQGAPTGTPTVAAAGFAFRYRPTTTGYFALTYGTINTDQTGTITYLPIVGANSGPNTTETQVQMRALSMTITKMYVKLNTAPGAGKSRTFTLRKNAADATCAVTISDTATAGSATCATPVAVSDDDLLTTKDEPTGTPSTSTPSVSYLATR